LGGPRRESVEPCPRGVVATLVAARPKDRGCAVKPARRALTIMYGLLACFVVVVAVLFVWPGYLVSHGCDGTLSGRLESVGGVAYCAEGIESPAPPSPAERHAECANATPNQMFFGNSSAVRIGGYSIGVRAWLFCSLVAGGYNFTVVEPNGSQYQGSIETGGGPPSANGSCVAQRCNATWLTPDLSAGVSFDVFRAPPLLALVRSGSS